MPREWYTKNAYARDSLLGVKFSNSKITRQNEAK